MAPKNAEESKMKRMLIRLVVLIIACQLLTACGTLAGAMIGAALGGNRGALKGALIGGAVDMLSSGQQVQQYNNYVPPTYYYPYYRPVCFSRPWCDAWGCEMMTFCQ